ncbi:unnamed protein product [Symbiodinium natans]|uniref:Reverse transcriptase domain-containing protein n=1 Tax=Symbiodinium natans TaxID=878477 RepID=A0A812MXH4_9DINO|nr:unnamed protein product [Symbiodinium natans]
MAGGRYHVCRKCGPASWIFAAKVPKFPKCQCGTLAKPARAEDVDLVALLQQHVGDLPQVIVDALPATPTPDPRQEGKEAGDVLRSSVGKLRDLGQRKLRLQEEIDTAKDNLRAMLHKMQDIQNAIEEAKVEVAKTTKEYEDKVVKHCAEEVNNGVESVLQALGMQEASLTEEQKRKLEALKSDEAKRRRMQGDQWGARLGMVSRLQFCVGCAEEVDLDPQVPSRLVAADEPDDVATGISRSVRPMSPDGGRVTGNGPTPCPRTFLCYKNFTSPKRILVTFHASQGCGYVIVALRSKGVDFNWISLYLESGTGLDSPVNDLILSSLTQHLSLLQGMWVVGGDSNVLIQDFLNSRYEERWQGRVVGSGSPTAGGDSEIDFFVVHPSLQSLSTVRLSFDTPFKPHGLLTLDVPVHSLQLRVETKYKEALASQTSQNSESYSKWLEEAQNDHLRPLYREVWDALCDLAREQVRSLPKHSASSVAKICAAKNPKKGGPDGWDFNDLRDLPRDAYAVLADVFNKMEEDLVIPLQVSQVQIVLLAKSALKERPIGLTSVLWRLWCKTRRILVGQWLDSYIPDHPFDSAIPGLRLSFPALALCLSLRLYQGGRTVVGESQPSPTIFPGLDHCDVWLDDVSADSLHASPDIAAGAAYEAFRVLKSSLQAEGLVLSQEKTKFVAGTPRSAAALRKLLRPGDPDIVDVVKDLGLDSGSGRRRRTTTAQKRFRVGGLRNLKLGKLRIPSRRVRLRLHRSSVVTSGLYGHEAQGDDGQMYL